MRRVGIVGLILAVGCLTLPSAGLGIPAAFGQASGLEATVTSFEPSRVTAMTGPTFDGSGRPLGQAQWRVVDGTGNCCENYIGVSKTGRIYDVGGSFPRFSSDQGATWSQVNPLVPLTLGGEGAVAMAPGGDVVGMVWEAYSGDRVITFKYDASTGDWLHSELLLHSPFFDRPWLSVIPGPFTVGGQSFPYISVMASNVLKQNYYYSVDGLNYVGPTSPSINSELPATQALDLPKDPQTDSLQAITEFGIAPLPGGGAISPPGTSFTVVGNSFGWDLLWIEPPDLTWKHLDLPGRLPIGRVIADSAGRLHQLSATEDSASFTYRMSSDGGDSWAVTPVTLPLGFRAEDWDFRTNSDLNVGVVGMHIEQGALADKDMVYEFDLSGERPALRRSFQVGLGDQANEGGVTQSIRFDFSTVGILPDGRIVTTFLDSKHLEPAMAILVSAPSPSAQPVSSPSPGSTTSPGPLPSPSTSPGTEPTTDTTAPLVSGVTDAPDPFSPNGDGKKEKTAITFNINEGADVAIVLRRKGRVVRRLRTASYEPGAWSRVWNGRNSKGRRVAAGSYTYVVRATDSAGNTGRASGTVTVVR